MVPRAQSWPHIQPSPPVSSRNREGNTPALRVQSKDPNNRALGHKYYTINGIWALKPYYLGPWTLRVYLIFHPLSYGKVRWQGPRFRAFSSTRVWCIADTWAWGLETRVLTRRNPVLYPLILPPPKMKDYVQISTNLALCGAYPRRGKGVVHCRGSNTVPVSPSCTSCKNVSKSMLVLKPLHHP